MLKQLRWDRIVANNTLTTLDSLQLRTVFVSPLLESTDTAIEYAGKATQRYG